MPRSYSIERLILIRPHKDFLCDGASMLWWNRVSQFDIPIAPDFRPLNDEEKKKFLTSTNAVSAKAPQEIRTKALLPTVDPIAAVCAIRLDAHKAGS